MRVAMFSQHVKFELLKFLIFNFLFFFPFSRNIRTSSRFLFSRLSRVSAFVGTFTSVASDDVNFTFLFFDTFVCVYVFFFLSYFDTFVSFLFLPFLSLDLPYCKTQDPNASRSVLRVRLMCVCVCI